MLNFSLLAKDPTRITLVVSLFALAITVLLIFLSSRRKGKLDSGRIAFAGISLALAFALSFLRLSPVLYGGSITLASFAPLLLFAYVYGAVDGLFLGLCFGLLNFISSPYVLTPLTFLLDYPLAFSSIALMGLFKKQSPTKASVFGTLLVYAVRFSMHVISGVIYFSLGAVWATLPNWAMGSAFVYSILYNLIYLPADGAICLVALVALSKTHTVERIKKLMLRSRKEKDNKPDKERGENQAQ